MTARGERQGHQHGHGAALAGNRRRLAFVLVITAGVLVIEVIGAVVSGSLALLADAGHMLTDVVGLSMAFVAATLAQRPASDRRTWGFRRAEVLAAALQAGLLLVVGGFIAVEAVRRLLDPPEVASTAMIIFGVVGLLGNVVGLMLLARSRMENLNMRAAFLEVLNDALGSVAVLLAAAVIALTGWLRADAVASLLIAALIIPRTVLLLRDSLSVLMESAPRHLVLAEVREHILGIEHVRGIHDLHATQVATGLPVLTAHLVVDDECFHDGHLTALLDHVQNCLAGHFDVEHSTIQFEPPAHVGHEQAPHPCAVEAPGRQ